MNSTLEMIFTVNSTILPRSGENRSTFHLVLESLSLIIIMLGAILFNVLTITIIVRVRNLRKSPHNILVFNLSVADLGVALASMTFSLASVFDGGSFLINHDDVCKMNGFLSIMFSFTNLPIILSIAADRLLIVVLSRRYPPNRSRVLVMVSLSWLVGIFIASIGLVIGYEYDPGTKHCTRIWENDVLRLGCSILYLGVTLPCLVAVYVVIAYFIRKEGLSLRSHQLSSSMPTLKSLSNMPNKSRSQSMDSCEESGTGVTLPRPAMRRRQPDSADDEDDISYGRESNSIGNINSTCSMTRREKKAKMKSRRQRHEAHKRVILMGALLVFTTVICWTPYLLYHSNFIRVREAEGYWFGVFTMWLGYCNALFDPLIYALLNRRVRNELWKLKRKTFARYQS
ncbi:alpha-2Da adrenergic receptor-like [Lytechinus pictus]|uniref:alpha-2Da adrenergic receptor-like n=1 Tax=Lytechinus pictus TaxID=7653 RepID=UPI0030B9C3E0